MSSFVASVLQVRRADWLHYQFLQRYCSRGSLFPTFCMYNFVANENICVSVWAVRVRTRALKLFRFCGIHCIFYLNRCHTAHLIHSDRRKKKLQEKMENTFILCSVCNSFQTHPAKAFLSSLSAPQNLSFAIPQQGIKKKTRSCEQFPLSISTTFA